MSKTEGVTPNSIDGLKEAVKIHTKRMSTNPNGAHPASPDGFMLSAMQWAIKELEKQPVLSYDI